MSSDDTVRRDAAVATSFIGNHSDGAPRISDPSGVSANTVEDRTDREASAPPNSKGFTSLRVLWLNAAALLLILLAILAIMRPSAIAIPDEGLYLAQADALTDGSWSVRRQAVRVDPDGDLDRLQPEAIVGNRSVPYARHSTYPLLLTPFYLVGGQAGTLTLSVLGTLGAAISGAFIARRMKPQYGLWTLWITGVGSPLLFDSFITMAHSIAAAAAGLAFLGATRALDDRRWQPLMYGIPALMLTVLLRSEGVIFGLGLSIAAMILALNVYRRNGIDRRGIVIASFLVFICACTYFVDTKFDQAITGVDGYGLNAASIVTSESVNRISGSWASLFRPFYGGWESAGLSVPIAALAIILASFSLRLMPGRTLLPLGFCLGAAAGGFGVLFNPPGLVTGLLAAFPVLAAGIIWIQRSDLRSRLVSRALWTSAIASIGIIATIHTRGGAAEWGGRFFHILLPLLVPLTVLGLDNARNRLSRGEAWLAFGCVLVFALSMSMSMLRWQFTFREAISDIVTSTASYASDATDEERPLVVVAGLYADGAARSFWALDDSIDVLNGYTVGNLANVLDAVKKSDRSSVVVVANVDGMVLQTILKDRLEKLGWDVLDSTVTEGGNAALIKVGDPANVP